MAGHFHASCARILRREAEFLPVESNFVIFDADDQETLVKRAVKELNLNEKLYRAPGVHTANLKSQERAARAGRISHPNLPG